MADKKTAAQRRVEALRIHRDASFRMEGPALVAFVHQSEFKGDEVAAKRVVKKFQDKGWTAMRTSNNAVTATVVVPR